MQPQYLVAARMAVRGIGDVKELGTLVQQIWLHDDGPGDGLDLYVQQPDDRASRAGHVKDFILTGENLSWSGRTGKAWTEI